MDLLETDSRMFNSLFAIILLFQIHIANGQRVPRPIAHLPPSPSLYRNLMENGGLHNTANLGTDRSHLIPVTLIRRGSQTSSFLDPLTGAIYLLPEADVTKLESERPITYATTNAFPSVESSSIRVRHAGVSDKRTPMTTRREEHDLKRKLENTNRDITFDNPRDWVIRRINTPDNGPAIIVRRRENRNVSPESSHWRLIDINTLFPGIDEERINALPKVRVSSSVLDLLNPGLRPTESNRRHIVRSQSQTKPGLPKPEVVRTRYPDVNLSKSTVNIVDDYTDDVEPWAPPPECEKVNCDFENGDACHYRDLSASASVNASFSVLGSRNLNKKWGTNGAVQQQNFVGAYLKPTERAVLKTRLMLTKSRVLRLYAYASVKGVEVLVCCGTLKRCPYVISSDVSAAGGKWKEMNLICPKGAKRIVIICRNIGKKSGACGVDYIRLLVNSDNPDRTFIDPCEVPETDYSDGFVDGIEKFFKTDIKSFYQSDNSSSSKRVANAILRVL